MDYEHRSKAWVDAHYRNSEARGGVGWADIPDRTEQAADRLDQLVREYGPPGGRMLEIGCGAGDISLLLAPRGLFDEIRGVDISEAAITWANRKEAKSDLAVHFEVGNMVDLRDFADDSFDAIVAAACLHWIIGDDRQDCLTNVCRVLKPGGRFCVWTSARSMEVIEPPDVKGESYFEPDSGLFIRNGLPCFHLKLPEEVLGEIGEAGFDVLHWELGERDADDSPYFSGTLIFVAAKPC